jgi:5-(carboxyamino)imidazole ribonucleotide mutase
MASPPAAASPTVGVIMGSRSDWETMKAAADVLTQFGVAYECLVVSAHRTPAWMVEYARDAESRNLQAIIAGAGGAAHLPGMVASMTTVPVIGVPVESRALSGLDSLLSMVQMPGGVPVATMAIGTAGATNAGLFAISLLATRDPALRARLQAWRDARARAVREETLE